MLVRRYKPSDCEQLSKLFYDTVHCVNINDYTKEQVNVWATGKMDLEKWNKSFLEHYTVVAVMNDKIVGFGDIDSTGYLDRLYVHKDYQRQGVATSICNELEKKFENIITHSSITAKGFFEKRGYAVIKEQQVERKGVYLTNYIMKKTV